MAWQLRFPVDEPVEVVSTHVDRDTGNFFVQLNNSDSSKLDDLMEEIVSFVARSSVDSKVKNLKVGDICLAKYVDEIWYRGKVLGVDNKNGFKIFFVDYGNSDFVEFNNVMPAPEQFLILPPQAFECELANVRPIGGHWGTELLVKLEELIIEQTFVAQAVSLKSNNVLVLSLFQDAAMSALAAEPLVLAGYLESTDVTLPCVQSGPKHSYKFLDLEELSFEDVYISYCENPNKFNCLLLKNSTALQKLMEELEMTYRAASEDDFPLTSCCQDNPCCAKFSEDDMWYRAIVTSESPSTSGEINVKFVDYGNSENVHISNLMELDERFLELPMQALECRLYGIKPKHGKVEWPQDAIELFQSLISEKHLVSYLNKVTNNTAEVFLFDTSEETQDVNFGQVLVDNGKAIAVKPLDDYKKAHHTQRRKSSFGIINLVPNSTEAIIVTNAESPSDFYCQLLKHSSDLDKLMNDLSEYYKALGDHDDTINLPQAGMLCCGKYTEDDGWYRALILVSNIANRQVEVLYVDYGNVEVLPITRIKELKPQFATLPQQAIPFCLYGVSPSAPSWTDKAIEEFQNAVTDKELIIKVVSQSESQRYSVSLMETVGEEEYSINKLLVQKGFAISEGDHPGVSVETDIMDYHPTPLEVGTYIDIEVSHVDNLDQFWCHLMSSNDEMESLMSNLQGYYNANPPKGAPSNTFSKGSPCCARFNDDRMWYRGKILEKMSNNRFKVRFVDFGNCEILTSKSVAVLNPEFLQLPVQSIKCSLENVSSSDKRNNKFVHKFLEMVNGVELVCRLDERDAEGKYDVLIINASKGGAININEEMAAFIAAPAKPEPSVKNVPKVTEPNITIGKEVCVYVTCVNSSENFHCQLATTSAQLDNVMNNMETFYRPLGANEETFTDPQVDDVCCALFTEDDGFYRAVVTKVTSNSIGVRYLDYGNSEELPLSRIKSLNASFTELPAQSFNAKSLGGGSAAGFEESVLDKELRAMIVSKDESGVYVVRLSDSSGTPLFSTGEKSTQQQQGASKRMLSKVSEAQVTVGKKVHVFVTSVTSPDDFFCQFTETSAQLDDLMNRIEEYYRPLGDQDEIYGDPQIGEACCAMFTEDEGWYRATVQTKHPGPTLDVCYMDYGNSETIPLSRVKILHQNFTTLPTQGFHACVKLAKGVDTTSFKDSLLEKELDANIVKGNGNDGYEVELFSIDGAKLFGSTADKKEAEVYQVKEANITMGSKEHVYVTSFTSPANFFCQLVKTSTQLDELMDRLEEFYRPLGDGEECIGNPQVADNCCAMFTEDDGWYRAMVTKVSGSKVEVKYLDYGNSEELPVSRVKRLLPCFAETSVQGFQASVVGGTSDGAEKIRAAIEGKELMVRVTDRKTSGGYGVEVYEMNGSRLFDSVQDAKKPEVNRSIKDFLSEYNIAPGVKLDVCGSHCDSPNMFYLHLVKNGKILDKLMTELDEVYSDLRPKDQALSNPVVGMFCAAKFPVDDGWYRAQILSIPSTNELEVSYIDFGNSERVGSHDIKILAPAFHKTAVQAVKCCLQGAKETWNANDCESFEILVLEKHLIAVVKAVDSKSKTLAIELRDANDLNILDVLSGKTEGSGKSSQEKLPKLASLPKLQLKDVENVLIESAQSLDSFVCQFSRLNQDLDAVADMMFQMYHEGTPPGFVTAPLQVGDVMAALFTEDETWYRASVAGLKPHGDVEVTFIDYGNSETIPKADICQRVRYLSKDLLRYPPMRGVTCSLSRVSIDGQRYSWTPRAHKSFVGYVVEKEFKARLSSDSEPYKTILEDTAGDIHAWLTREKLVASTDTEPEVVLEDFYELEVEEGSSWDVYVTSVVNPEKFYVQQAVNGEAIDKVMDDVHVSCTDGSQGEIININVGTLCAAQYTADNAWYRARVIKETGPDSCEVMFVDYGNSEVLSKDRMKELDPSFLELPAQALCCCLQMKQPVSDTETSERFEQVTADKCLKMTVVKVLDGKLLVRMRDEEGLLLNDMFEEKPRESTVKESSETVEITLSPFPVTEKQTAEVYMSHVASPREFYVQFSNTEEELERLTERAAETYDGPESKNYSVNNHQLGMFCCARYSEDNAWYRAQIIDLTNETATVRFVDHGNTDVVNLSSDLRQLSADLSRSPCQAIPCSLARGPWSPEQCSSFEAAVMDKPLQATFNENVNNMWMVTLQDGSTTLNQLQDLQNEKPCVKMPCLSAGDEPSVYIVSVNSPDDVILQLSSHVSELEALMNDIANNPPQVSLPLAQAECGIYCLARFTEDEAWYRAKVLECVGDKIKVLYIDFGNEEWITSDRLAPISARFSDLPEVCIRCTLELSTVCGTWGENSGEKLLEIYGEKELRCQIISKIDKFSVKLFRGEEDVLSKVVISGELSALNNEESSEMLRTRYEMKQLNAGDKKNATCSHIETPRKLWFQFLEDQQTLDDLMNRLDEVYNALGAEEQLLKIYDVGVPCCGQFLDDDGWYRAEILGMEDEGVKVRYIDYGNEEVLPTSRLRSLKPEFLSTPRQAVACLLKDIQASGNKWSQDAVTLVESFITERAVVVEITSMDQLVVTGVVYGSSEDLEVSLNDLLVERSFAVKISHQAIAKEPEFSNTDTAVSYTMIPAKIGDKLNLFYVSAVSPASIWCQLSDSETELLDLMEKLGAFYGNLCEQDWALEVLVVGAAVCAQFTEDDSWYRAEILETSPTIMVRFVDYGNCEELPRSRVKRLKQEFSLLPIQAISIALTGVSPQSLEDWSQQKKVAMEELCSEKSYIGEIHGITETALEASLQDQQTQAALLDELCLAELIVKKSEVSAVVTGVTATSLAAPSKVDIYVSDCDSEVVVPELEICMSESDVSVSESDVPVLSASDVPLPKSDVYMPGSDVSVPESDGHVSESDVPVSELDVLVPEMEMDSPVSELESPVPDSRLTEKYVNESLEDSVGIKDCEVAGETDPSNEDRRVTEANQEQPLDNARVFEEPLSDELPSVETKADGVFPSASADNTQTENVNRTTSPGDSEEDLDDAQAVCHAIDRLLTEIESHTSVGDRSSAPDTCDTELSVLGINNLHLKTSCNEEVICSTPSGEVEAASDEVSMVSTTNAAQNCDSSAPENESNTASVVKLDSEISDFGTEQSELEASATEEKVYLDKIEDKDDKINPNELLEISTPIAKLYENQSASESDSATGSSNATPFLSPEVELTDESQSDEMSAYLTPPDELETTKEKEAVLSSPESDRAAVSDVRRRYTYPEIYLGDIHKVVITHIQSPSSFFCQLSRTEIELSHLMETIQTTFTEHNEDTLTIDTPTVSIPCCAQSSEDGKWYRGLVRNLGSDNHVNVTLVDFGKTVSLPLGRVKAISDELVTSLPRQAVHCSLVDLEPANSEWSADAVTKMTEVCAGKELEGIFRSRHHKIYDIYLRDLGNDASDFVNKLLVDLKLAKVTGRDSDSEEGADPNGNGELYEVLKPGDDNDEQLSSDGNNYQCESSKTTSTETVKVILDSILERATNEAVKTKAHLTREIVDVLKEESKSEDVTFCEIQNEGETSGKMFSETLIASEVCNIGTEETPQDETATSDNEESKGFLGRNGLNEDLCLGNDAQLAETVVVKSDAEMEEKLENVAASHEINTKVGCNEASNDDSEQENIGIYVELDGLEEDTMQTDEKRKESENGTVDCGSEMKESYNVPVEDKNCFADEPTANTNKGEVESERKGQEGCTVPDGISTKYDGKCGDDGMDEEVETDAKIDCERKDEILKVSSEEQDEKSECDVKDQKEHAVPEEKFSESIPDLRKQIEDTSVDTSREEVTAIMVELLDSADDSGDKEEKEEKVEHISLLFLNEEARPSDEECGKGIETVVLNSEAQPEHERETVNGEDYQEPENVEFDWKKHKMYEVIHHSLLRDEEMFLVQVESREDSDEELDSIDQYTSTKTTSDQEKLMVDNGQNILDTQDKKKVPDLAKNYKEKEGGVEESGECGKSVLLYPFIENRAMNASSKTIGIDKQNVCYSELSELDKHTGRERRQFLKAIDHETLKNQESYSGCKKEVKMLIVYKEVDDTPEGYDGDSEGPSSETFEVDAGGSPKQPDGTETEIDSLNSAACSGENARDENGANTLSTGIGCVEQRSLFCNNKFGELVSEVGNVLIEQPRLKNDSSDTSSEKAVLDDLVGNVVLRQEVLSGNDDDLDID